MPVGDGSGSGAPAVMLGAAIRELRQSLGWSQSRMATELCKVANHATVTRENVSRVDRRHFLTDIVGVSIAHLVASDLIEHGFAAALHGGYPTADDWGQAVDTYGRDYMTLGAGEIQKRLAADLVVLQQQLNTPCLWAVSAKLATLYGKTFPGTDGAKALTWYRHAATFADRSGDMDARVWVRGRAAIALGYEGASLNAADRFAEQAIALDERPSLGRLNAVMGKAHVAAIRGDSGTDETAR